MKAVFGFLILIGAVSAEQPKLSNQLLTIEHATSGVTVSNQTLVTFSSAHTTNETSATTATKHSTNHSTSATTATKNPTNHTTSLTTSTKSLTNATTTASTTPTASKTPQPSQKFSVASFMGGFVLCLGLGVVAFFTYKFYQSRRRGDASSYQNL